MLVMVAVVVLPALSLAVPVWVRFSPSVKVVGVGAGFQS